MRAVGTRPLRLPETARPPVGGTLIIAACAFCLFALGYAMTTTSYDIWAGFMIAPLLLLTLTPLATRIQRDSDDRRLAQIVVFGGALKVLAGTGVQYFITFNLYERADAERYHLAGKVLAGGMRHGIISSGGQISGTRFAELITGAVYAVTGVSKLAGFFVFSWFGFLGLYLMLRAFMIALPRANARLFAALLFFTPSLLTWPSAIGKEAFMIFVLGMASYGVTILHVQHRAAGLIYLGLGIWGTAVMRPHVALLLVLSITGAAGTVFLVGRRPTPGDRSVGLQRAASFVVLVLAGLIAITVTATAESFFNLSDLDPESAEQVFTDVQRNSGTGGSEFNPPDPQSIPGYLEATVTVIARPFPTEAGSMQGIVSSLEGSAIFMLLLLALVRGRGRLRQSLRTNLLPSLSAIYVLGFVYAFAAISNFGILARQRVQLLPFLFVLITVGLSTERPTPESLDHQSAGRSIRDEARLA